MSQRNVLDGVFAINKPIGMSSAQVIRDCQHYFDPSSLFAPHLEQEKAIRAQNAKAGQKRRGKANRELHVKMGHGGTLDPLATGVLILGVGKGTKSLQSFLECTKIYEAVVVFGASTDSYDRCGRVIKRGRYDDVTRPAVEKALEGFRGKIKQMPPLYSALKMEGKPLYEYAREGKPIPREIATRDVDVSELELVEWYGPGTHDHRWPAEEAQETEKNFANSLWRVAKRQAASEEEPAKLTPEQEEEESKALAEWESTKRKAEARVDGLVYDGGRLAKRRKIGRPDPVMSGALGDLPAGRGSNLIPPKPAPNTPPPWEGKGPPAAKIRMTVSSGFYVRSLCHDLGEKLQCGAIMAELCRLRQGDFFVGGPNCLEYSDLAKGEEVWGPRVGEMLSLWNGGPSGSSHPKPQEPRRKENSSNEVNHSHSNQGSRRAERVRSSSPPPKHKGERTSQGQASALDSGPAPGSPRPKDSPSKTTQSGPATATKDGEEEWNGFPDEPSVKTEDDARTTGLSAAGSSKQPKAESE